MWNDFGAAAAGYGAMSFGKPGGDPVLICQPRYTAADSIGRCGHPAVIPITNVFGCAVRGRAMLSRCGAMANRNTNSECVWATDVTMLSTCVD